MLAMLELLQLVKFHSVAFILPVLAELLMKEKFENITQKTVNFWIIPYKLNDGVSVGYNETN
jgi:hypothetical protein